MVEHLAVAIAAVPFQVALGVFNTQKHMLTRGEVRFWCIVIFVTTELIYLGFF